MSAKTKHLLVLLGILTIMFLVVRVGPMVSGYYSAAQQEVAMLQERVERLEKLVADTGVWNEREILKQAEVAGYESWIFEGNNPSLVGSSVQRSLRQAVAQAGINAREMSVARFSQVGDWLLVSQEMSFILTEDNILPFLQALQELRPRLHVTAFSVAHNRRQYTGNITVVGFSRSASTPAAVAER